MARTTKSGIIMDDTFSTPCFTPAMMTRNTISANRTNQNSALGELAMNAEKYSSVAMAAACPRRYSKRYLVTQPPITQ